MLSGAKNPSVAGEILRSAQHDSSDYLFERSL